MKEEFKDVINYLLLTVHFVIAFVAGSMKELNKLQSRKFSFRNLIANGAVSSFAGVIAFLILDYFGLDWRLCAAGTGIAGWSGSYFMDYLSLVLKKRINKITDTNITVDEERSHSELINK